MKSKFDLMLIRARVNAKRLVKNDGSEFISMLIKILISVVVGALLLTLIVALINALWPELTQKIMTLFSSDATSAPTTSQ